MSVTQSLGPIAQLGARLNGIEKVVGSNPTGSTQPEAPVLKPGFAYQPGRSIRRSARELGSPGVSSNKGACRAPAMPNSPVALSKLKGGCVGESHVNGW